MPSIVSLINQLSNNYPNYKFEKSHKAAWAPDKNTIYYGGDDNDDRVYILHELSHALLKHSDYDHDVKLIAMERDAWGLTSKLAEKYGISIDDELIQNCLDTYRDWLHSRSLCPNCSSNGVQSDKSTYKCISCGHKWRVNEARLCALRRYKI